MRSFLVIAGFLACVFAASMLAAQEAPEFPQPQMEHEWLRQFVGEWEAESQAAAAPGQPAMTCKGTMRSRMLGGFWVISEVQTDMMGTKVNAIQTVGYDPEKKKYIGTWVDSMMNHLWKYEGSVDESGKKLTLEAEGPNFLAAGKTAKFRDTYEFKSPDHLVTTAQMQGDDGQWMTFMSGHARRKK
jgi:hypothetical protein